MFCTSCGTALPENAAFCPGCGTKVQAAAAGSTAAAPAPRPEAAVPPASSRKVPPSASKPNVAPPAAAATVPPQAISAAAPEATVITPPPAATFGAPPVATAAAPPEAKSATAKSSRMTLGVFCLIGGVLALVGLFTPWLAASLGAGSLSAWTMIRRIGGQMFTNSITSYLYLAFIGAILAFIGALGVLGMPKIKVLWLVPALGGLLAVVGAGWGLEDILANGSGLAGGGVHAGIGLYLILAGGVVALLGGYRLRT